MTTCKESIKYMRRALELAKRGLYTTGSNPRVGCVLVKDDRIIGEGWHRQDGDEHAETMALASLSGTSSHKASAWITLEPCCHFGKQPPCTDALILAGIDSIFIASQDPNPLVAGNGVKQLKEAGIRVTQGILSSDSYALNVGFHKRMTTKLPWLRLKTAISLDGKIATADGSSQWITGQQARADNMHWRARAQAIVTSSSTVALDNPQMTARDLTEPVNQPHPVILDSQLSLSPKTAILQRPATLISCRQADSSKYHKYLRHVRCSEKNGHIDLHEVCQWLAEQGYNEIHIEAGAKLSGAFMEQGLIDEMLIYQAPVLLGHRGKDAFELSIDSMNERYMLEITERRMLGNDWRLRLVKQQ